MHFIPCSVFHTNIFSNFHPKNLLFHIIYIILQVTNRYLEHKKTNHKLKFLI